MAEIATVLVTGGCGFIGSNLVRYMREHTSWSLRIIDDLRSGTSAMTDEDLADVRIGDVSDDEVLSSSLDGADAVVHLASQTGVVPSLEDPVRDFNGNPALTFQVLEQCRTRGIEHVIFASSGAAVGEVSPPLHENVVPRPVSPYGAGKLTGEAFCSAYARSFGMQTVSLRFSNVYGPYSLHKGSNVVPNFIKRSLQGLPLDVFGDGRQTRDFIHVDDVCAGIVRSLKTADIAGEVFQLATGVETSIAELAKITQEVTGSTAEIRFGERRAGEVYKSSVDISKARRVLGFEPKVALRDGITMTAKWYRENWLRLEA